MLWELTIKSFFQLNKLKNITDIPIYIKRDIFSFMFVLKFVKYPITLTYSKKLHNFLIQAEMLQWILKPTEKLQKILQRSGYVPGVTSNFKTTKEDKKTILFPKKVAEYPELYSRASDDPG